MYGDHVNQMVTFIDNHDRNRFLTEAGGDIYKMKNATTYWGQSVYLSGDCEALGNWDPALAAGPASCPDYPKWTFSVKLPIGKNIEFKAIMKDESGNVTWKSGNNHSYTVPSEGGNYTIHWN